MKYKPSQYLLGKLIFDYVKERVMYHAVLDGETIWFTQEQLEFMGGLPNEPKDKDSGFMLPAEPVKGFVRSNQCTCGKCGETEGTELCPKCGAESYGNCPCKPKEEKIEIKLPNLNIKLPREILDPDSGHTEEFRHWAVQMTTSVNKLNGDN
jgi:hypothetical protein